LTLALLADAARAFDLGRWPAGWPPPPRFDRMVGIEHRRRLAEIARKALGEDAEIVDRDAREVEAETPTAVLFFDVLHLMPIEDQDALIGRIASSLGPGGVMIVRE